MPTFQRTLLGLSIVAFCIAPLAFTHHAAVAASTSKPLASAHTFSQNTVGEAFGDALLQRYQPTINTLTNHGWDHSNSVILHGLEKIYKKTKNKKYFDYIKKYVDDYVQPDGSIQGLLNTMDGIHPGVLCLFMYEQTQDKKYLNAAKNMRNHLLGTPQNPSAFNKTPDGAYWHKNAEKYHNVSSVDGLYMAYPFIVHYAVLTEDKNALDAAIQQILLISERSFNIKYKLPFHAWNYDKTKAWANPITGTSSQFWSRASGWYAMALVDVLEHLPKEHPEYKRIAFLYRSFAEGLKRTQNPKDGFWYQVLDAYNQPNNYAESSSTGMIVYSLKKAVRLGLVDKQYKEVAQKGWKALLSVITQYKDGGPQISSFAPGMSSQMDYEGYVAIRPVSVPSAGKKQNAHGYMGALMAAAEMEP